jgi:hypothetical protein
VEIKVGDGGATLDPHFPCGASPQVGGFLHSSYVVLHRLGSLGVADFWSGGHSNPCTWQIFHLEKTHFSSNGSKCLRVCFLDVHLDWVSVETPWGLTNLT